MDVRPVADEHEQETVREMLRTEFEVCRGFGEAFARLYDDVRSTAGARSLVAVEEEKVIGHALFVLRDLRMADVDVPAALVGMVVVAPDRRKRGVGGALMAATEVGARAEGALLMQIAGAIGYYSRFGYVDAYVDHQVDLPSVRGASSFRPADTGDVDLLSTWSAEFVPDGAVVPSAARWAWLLKSRHPASLIRLNRQMLGLTVMEDQILVGRRGFVRLARGDGEGVVYEAGCQAAEGKTMRAEIQGLGAELGLERVTLRLPSQHPVLRGAQPAERASNPEFLIKSLDTRRLVQRVRSTLEERAGSVSRSAEDRVRLVLGGFEVEIGVAVRILDEGETDFGEGARIFVPEIGLVRALLGRDSLGQMVTNRGGDARIVDLINVVLPPGEPFFWLSDAI